MNSGFQADFNNTHIKKLLCCLSTILRWLLHILRIICYFEHLKYMYSHSMLSPKKSFGKLPPPTRMQDSLDVTKELDPLLNTRIKNRFWSVCCKENEMKGRYNWRGPPYHMMMHALQTVLHLNKKYSV